MASAWGKEGSLWMGDTADYMDENFIKAAFAAMDESVVMVKFVKNKYTGTRAGYCFVHFKDNETALRVLHKLNGKIVPNTQPPIRFTLNHSHANKSYDKEFSLWCGDLDLSVDDEALYQAFATRYSTVRAARVVKDKETGVSRGYAFVRFGSEEEHKDALTHMNGFDKLANKPMRVSIAVPRNRNLPTSDNSGGDQTQPGAGGDYSAYYDQYWQNYYNWQNYSQYGDPSAAAAAYQQAYPGYGQAAAVTAQTVPAGTPYTAPAAAPAATPVAAAEAEDENEVVEHDVPVDVDRQNQEFVMQSEEFWDALDASRWLQPDSLNPLLEVYIKT